MNAAVRVVKPVVLWFAVAVGVPSASAGNVPVDKGEARTPETRTLTAEEAAAALKRDWLFQAMGEPLLDRAEKEIAWARELAERISRRRRTQDLSAEPGGHG